MTDRGGNGERKEEGKESEGKNESTQVKTQVISTEEGMPGPEPTERHSKAPSLRPSIAK